MCAPVTSRRRISAYVSPACGRGDSRLGAFPSAPGEGVLQKGSIWHRARLRQVPPGGMQLLLRQNRAFADLARRRDWERSRRTLPHVDSCGSVVLRGHNGCWMGSVSRASGGRCQRENYAVRIVVAAAASRTVGHWGEFMFRGFLVEARDFKCSCCYVVRFKVGMIP